MDRRTIKYINSAVFLIKMKKRRNNRTTQIFLGAIIVFIMITSVIGFMSGQGSEQEIKYNDYSFVRKGNLWETKIDKKPVTFYYFPSEVEIIEFNESIPDRILSTPMVYFTYDPEQEGVEIIAQMQFELEAVLKEYFGVYSEGGMTKENAYGAPVITCLNATNAVPVIEFRKTSQTKIYLEENCIVVEAKSQFDFIKDKDRLAYGLFGIIK